MQHGGYVEYGNFGREMALILRRFASQLPALPKLFATGRKNCRLASSSVVSFSEAFEKIKENLTAKPNDATKRLFVGTGQFYEHKTNERLTVLSLGDDENTKPPLMLLDASLNREDVDRLVEELSSLPSVGTVCAGEVDSVQDSPWKFGFVIKPPFSIFSVSGFCCQLRHSNYLGGLLRVYDGVVHEDIPLADIGHVQVSLSPEPWEEHRLQLRMKDGDLVTVVEDCEERNSSDLALLMLSTEWIVKASGFLCLLVRQSGNDKVELKLPSVLRADVNPWVAVRNRIWAEKGKNS